MKTNRRAALALLSLVAAVWLPIGLRAAPAAVQADEEFFSVVVLPDTQFYSERYPDTFHAQTGWIRENAERENIVFVSHVGDIVQHGGSRAKEWKVAAEAMSILDGVVPWGVAIGNHDYDRLGKTATTFQSHFGAERFADRAWYGGESEDGLNSYQLFRGGGRDFLILHLEADVPDGAVAWAEGVLRRYPTRPAIVSTHIYLYDRSKARGERAYMRTGGNSGEAIWQKLIRRHRQIFMVVCGHWSSGGGEHHQVSSNEAGAPVIELLSDYQSRKRGGDGWMRIMRFVPARKELRVRSYSPTLDRWETDADSQFTLPLELGAVAAW